MSTITKPFTFSAGAIVIASEHNSNFDTIYTDYNGGITNANISASAAIAYSKLTGVAASGANSDITALTGLTTPLGAAYGGTGVANNVASTLTRSGNHALTITTTNTTGVTLPTSGTLITDSSTDTLTNKTLTSPKLNENVAVTTTATKLNYITSATGTTGTASTNIVFSTSPVLTTPNIGTPSAGVLTSCTGLPVASVVSDTSTALGVGTIELGHASNTTLSQSSAGVLAVEGVVIPSISSTNTFTNKFITPQVQSVADAGGTFTPVSITNDVCIMTALSQATTIAAPTGSPVSGEKLIFRIKDNGTARALTWNAIYRVVGVTLPTTTVISKYTYVGCVYNTTDTKWDVIATAQEA